MERLGAAQPPERPLPSIAIPFSIEEHLDAEEWSRVESASSRANASLEIIRHMLGNLGEAVSIAYASMMWDLIPYGEHLLKRLVVKAEWLQAAQRETELLRVEAARSEAMDRSTSSLSFAVLLVGCKVK